MALVITRRIGESIIIGDEITVTVLKTEGNQAKLGFSAPKGVLIDREEIRQQIELEKEAQRVSTFSLSGLVKSIRSGSLDSYSNEQTLFFFGYFLSGIGLFRILSKMEPLDFKP